MVREDNTYGDLIVYKNKCSFRWLEEMDDMTAWVHVGSVINVSE